MLRATDSVGKNIQTGRNVNKLKAFALAHVNICTTGHCAGSPGVRKTILGKEFNNVCTSEVAFFAPGTGTLQNVMKMIEIWINAKNYE